MRISIVISIAAIALCGCASSSSSQLDAMEVCMRAGFQPQDKDYAECMRFTQQYRAETRRDKLHKELDAANRPLQQARQSRGVRYSYSGAAAGL